MMKFDSKEQLSPRNIQMTALKTSQQVLPFFPLGLRGHGGHCRTIQVIFSLSRHTVNLVGSLLESVSTDFGDTVTQCLQNNAENYYLSGT